MELMLIVFCALYALSKMTCRGAYGCDIAKYFVISTYSVYEVHEQNTELLYLAWTHQRYVLERVVGGIS